MIEACHYIPCAARVDSNPDFWSYGIIPRDLLSIQKYPSAMMMQNLYRFLGPFLPWHFVQIRTREACGSKRLGRVARPRQYSAITDFSITSNQIAILAVHPVMFAGFPYRTACPGRGMMKIHQVKGLELMQVAD